MAKANVESKLIEGFLQWLNTSKGYKTLLEERPEPPDALFTLNNRKMWLEIVDAHRSNETAREFNTAITPNKKPYYHREVFFINPDHAFMEIVLNQIWLKVCKSNYLSIFSELGPGILLVHCPMTDGLYDEKTFNLIADWFADFQEHCRIELGRANASYRGYLKWVFIAEGWHQFKYLGALPVTPVSNN